MSPTIAWEGKDYFAAVAAVLGVAPDMIMAAYGEHGVTVLYTREGDRDASDPPIWAALLGEDLSIERNEDTGRTFSSFLPLDEGDV